jgi:hypothetical protein
MLTVSAVEFQRNFGRYQDGALNEPLSIVLNSHDRLVLMSRNKYQQLKRRERIAFKTEDLSEVEIEAIFQGEMDARHNHLNAELNQDTL